ncbi:hypothetical protein [Burkholderia ambifaria]|uniref:hypothetical protein n=1 Tax=Burkholderia ambifaria TaxID=152480 RepID=UPI00158EE190|nr:hypothetical protein [Burkholderia ambifaria]
MPDYPRFTINRCVILITPNQPFFDWMMEVDLNPDPKLTLDEIRHDQDAFLIPDSIEFAEDAVRWVERRWQALFEHLLNQWFAKSELWPKKPTLTMFREWFTITHYPTVWDLGTTRLTREDWSDASENDESPNGAIH